MMFRKGRGESRFSGIACGGEITMSDFFAPLLEPKPSAAFKLIAAWEGLSLESQMKLLLALKDTRRGILPDEIARKALSSPNAYLRFLAAKMIGRKEGHPLLDMIA